LKLVNQLFFAIKTTVSCCQPITGVAGVFVIVRQQKGEDESRSQLHE